MELKGVWLFLFMFNLIGVTIVLLIELVKVTGLVGVVFIVWGTVAIILEWGVPD